MSFLAPTMLWGVLAAGIPIALHFFYRSRYRTVPWAAMKFLLASIEQTSRRLRFQELLLLILRVTLLVLLALALSRPSTSATSGSARGDAVDAVIVIDTSLSMGAREGTAPVRDPGTDPYLTALKQFAGKDGSITRLDRARAAAQAVIASLPRHSTVQIISASDRASLLGPEAPAHLDRARQLIQNLDGTHQASDYMPAINEAAAVLERGHSPNRELYLISDMQQLGWEQQGPLLREKLQEIREKATIHLVHCATRTPSNVAIVGITPQSSLRRGERADFAVLVRNSGKEPIQNLTVSLEVDGQTSERDSKPLEKLKGGESQAVILTGLLNQPGRRILTARVSHDDLEADNRFDQIIQVHDQVGVLLVDGAPDDRDPRKSASFFLQHALNPRRADVATPLPVEVVSPANASPKLLANKDLCILVDARLSQGGDEEAGSVPPEFIKALAAFVQDGHALMIFAGNHVDAEAYNRLLFEQHRLLPMKITGIASAPTDKPLTMDRQSAVAYPFLRFRQEGFTSIDKVEVRKALDLEEPKTTDGSAGDEVRVLLRFNNGRPAIVSKKRAGEGEVMLFTTSVNDPNWTDWFIGLPFVPFVQVSVNYLLEGQPQVYNRVAGEPLRWQPPRTAGAAVFDLVRPDGGRVRLGYPDVVESRPVVTASDTPRAGIYRLTRADGVSIAAGDTEEGAIKVDSAADKEPEGVPFAVVPDLRDTEDLTAFTPAQLDERLGFKAIHMMAGGEGNIFSGAERLKREWTIWLLAGLLLLTLGEPVLAWACGKAW